VNESVAASLDHRKLNVRGQYEPSYWRFRSEFRLLSVPRQNLPFWFWRKTSTTGTKIRSPEGHR